MFTFGFFTTSIPYALLVLGYLFYFVTATVNEDLAEKWFSFVAPIEICSDDKIAELENGIDDYDVIYSTSTHPVYIPEFACTPQVPIGEPHAAFLAIVLSAPSLSRPPNV